MIEFEKVINIILCLFICSAAMPLTCTVTKAIPNTYVSVPDQRVTVVNANIDSSRNSINVVYDLNSDFYPDSGTRFFIGYQYVDQRKSSAFKDQFREISGPKGRYSIQLPYPGFPAKVTISTYYTKVGYDGPLYNSDKLTIVAVPHGQKVTIRTITYDDVVSQKLILKSVEYMGKYFTERIDFNSTAINTIVGEALDNAFQEAGQELSSTIVSRITYHRAFPPLSVGQVVKVTSWSSNDIMYERITIWRNGNLNNPAMYNDTGFMLIT